MPAGQPQLRHPPAAIFELLSTAARTRLIATDLRHLALNGQRERRLTTVGFESACPVSQWVLTGADGARGALITIRLRREQVRWQIREELLEGHKVRRRAKQVVQDFAL